MSIEENKAKVRRVWEEVMNKGNLAVADELMPANYIFHGPGGIDAKGPEGFKQYVTIYRTAFPDLHCTIEDMVAEEEKVVSRFTLRGTHLGDMMGIPPTGKKAEIVGIVKNYGQFVLLLIIFDGYNMICLCHLGRHFINHIRGNINVVEVDIFHPTLRCKSNLKLLFIN